MTLLTTLQTSNFLFMFFGGYLGFIILMFVRFIFFVFFYKVSLYNVYIFYVFVKVQLSFQYHIAHKKILNLSLNFLNIFLFDIGVLVENTTSNLHFSLLL